MLFLPLGVSLAFKSGEFVAAVDICSGFMKTGSSVMLNFLMVLSVLPHRS